jgi:hypothetical protein
MIINTIKSILATKSSWRAHVAREYPNDRRNALSAELLDQLAKGSVSADILAQLDSFTPSEIKHACTEMAVKTGFRVYPQDLSEFIELLAAKLEEKQAAQRDAIAQVFGGAK